MRSSRKKDLTFAVLVAVLVAAAGLLPLAYRYGTTHRPVRDATTIAGGPPPAAPAPAQPVPGPLPGATPGSEAMPPAAPGAEEVPAEETDRGPTATSPAGPTISAARAAGLHLKPDPMHLNSSAALVMDQDTGQVLAQKNADAVLPMASLTKVMTALVVLEAQQPMGEVLTITDEDVDYERNSRSRLRVGTQLTREEALHLALMSSENRAAHALGRAYPGGLPKLVETMNARARQIGMVNTSYVDPTGLSNRNQSTAHDLALLVRESAKHPVIRDFSTTPAKVATLGSRTLQYRNSNRLVRNEAAGWDIELQKTGYIVEAGRCLTMLTKVAGHNLIMVLLDADNNSARVADAHRLRQWVVAQNGWQDDLALAQAKARAERRAVAAKDDDDEDEKPQKVASAKSRKAAAGKGDAKKKDVAVARAGKAGAKEKDVVAKRKGGGKDGEVVAKGRKGGAKDDEVVAKGRKGGAKDKEVAAAKPKRSGTAVAKKSDGKATKKEGRVRQTFAAGANTGT